MTAKYWTRTGEDIWKVKARIIVFENLETGEESRCECVAEVTEKNFTPVTMPEIEQSTKTPDTEKPNAKTSRRGPKAKSKYKGVSPSKTAGKFRAQFWNGANNNYIGTFDSELLAAAAYQEHIGNHKEAKRLRNEYEEGDPNPAEGPSEE